MKKWIALGICALLAGVAALAFVFQRPLGERAFASAAAQRAGGPGLEFGEGLHLALCGTGSPLPDPERAGPCNLVVAGGRAYVVDIGEGGARNLNLMGFDIASLDGLLLTHFHSDHIDGIGPLALLYWTQGTKTAPLPVHGAQGLETVVDGFNMAYSLDHTYRVAHHGEAIVPPGGGGLAAVPLR